MSSIELLIDISFETNSIDIFITQTLCLTKILFVSFTGDKNKYCSNALYDSPEKINWKRTITDLMTQFKKNDTEFITRLIFKEHYLVNILNVEFKMNV